MLLLMDCCRSRDGLEDDRGRVAMMVYLLNCTSGHQPMDIGIIVVIKLIHKGGVLDVNEATYLMTSTLAAHMK